MMERQCLPFAPNRGFLSHATLRPNKASEHIDNTPFFRGESMVVFIALDILLGSSVGFLVEKNETLLQTEIDKSSWEVINMPPGALLLTTPLAAL